MNTVKESKNQELQKNIIENFINEKNINLEDLYKFLDEIIKLESDNIGYISEFSKSRLEKEENIVDISLKDVSSCVFSDSLGKDIIFWIDAEAFYKKYFKSNKKEERIKGIYSILVIIYSLTYQAKNLVDVNKSVLSPKTLEVSREILLNNSQKNSIYKTNHEVFTFENLARRYAKEKIDKIVVNEEVKKLNKIENLKNSIRKVKFENNFYTKEDILEEVTDEEVYKNPGFLYLVPIMQKIYDENGNKKELLELFNEMFLDIQKIIRKNISEEEMQEEFFETQTFYYEIISLRLNLATENEYKSLIKKYGTYLIQNIFTGMEKYFNYKVQVKLKILETVKDEKNIYQTETEIKEDLKHIINSIVRFKNGITFNEISEKLLREGGFIRGTREILEEDIEKRRELFANALIGAYDAVESELEYRRRAEAEKDDIDKVINSLYYNRLEDLTKIITVEETEELFNEKAVKFICLLKIAKIIEATTNREYFSEFLKIPDVNKYIYELEKDKKGYLSYCMEKTRIRIKKVEYPKTEIEEGKYKDYILGNSKTPEDLETTEKIQMLNKEIEKKETKKRLFGRKA